MLSLSHNQLQTLPAPVLGIPAMRELIASNNLVEELVGPIQLMEGLQVIQHMMYVSYACIWGVD